jgi:collagenase-like PrtC family protease
VSATGIRIAVGLPGNVTDAVVRSFVDEGADEFFVGYVPPSWWKRYGIETSPNRRHRAAAQLLTREALEAFAAAAHQASVPFHVTLNSHLLTAADIELIDEIVATSDEVGAAGVILTDLALGPRVAERHPRLLLITSGEAGIYSREGLRLAARLGFSRVVLARELTVEDTVPLAEEAASLHVELEAFVLGEWCVYNGAACFTAHGYGTTCDFCSAHVARALVRNDGREARLDPGPRGYASAHRSGLTGPLGAHGWGGCRICSIPRLQDLGIAALKLPGRQSEASGAVALIRRVLRARPATVEEVKRLVADPVFCSGASCR